MKAVVLERTGEPDVLTVREVAEPAMSEGLTLVHVRAAGVTFQDVLIRQGRYPHPPVLPFVPGNEIAGVTVEGRRVVGLMRTGGGYAEDVAVSDAWLFDLPESASFAEGACFLTAFLTAWLALTQLTETRTGRRVLVHGAAGGVGSAAVQIGSLLGGEVVAAVGSSDKLELPRRLGAREALTYDELGSVGPVDVVVDPVGGDLFAGSLKRLAPLGVTIAIGFAGGPWPTVQPERLVGRNVGVRGFYLGRLMRHRPELVRRAADDLLRFWTQGLLAPVVGGTFPLERAAEAHSLLEGRLSTGRLVLVP